MYFTHWDKIHTFQIFRLDSTSTCSVIMTPYNHETRNSSPTKRKLFPFCFCSSCFWYFISEVLLFLKHAFKKVQLLLWRRPASVSCVHCIFSSFMWYWRDQTMRTGSADTWTPEGDVTFITFKIQKHMKSKIYF